MQEGTKMEEKTDNKMSPVMILVIIVVVALIGFLAMRVLTPSQQPEMTQTAPTQAMTTEVSPTAGEAMTENAVTFDVEGGSFYYKPNELKVKKGQKVTINFKAVDLMHDFVVDELNVKSDTIKGGESTTFEFTPDKAGTFEFYCSVGQHRANGMVGTLIVEE
ncbi:hypothetical protein A2866_02925 [Candidatus Roizmanbacteria bacterium RIFCSPHIGHO2_01_FULL_39_8]|uniref:EfeO-type cupredoxin-like domain-containing protein n=3 Tax=Candidatus Roizmaniibacteriota TaxID=1752723 RepID=A0A1F7GGK9_9BACT|nr:MAG: hypothetical protein A2866_02925 [Candidatus Roizmanbacteria bacterium RIFCSPHIGHO2_01_FULL_39_8]OGK27557.1 MAG: hypothetical protein A3C28_06010 [Candidatus Roizmanbacteria bacterium RIFCSPHIGHO2_02_FULL_39_9]OGK37498.1 MAG: hypothetical protein A3F60_02700 [Candidatus Roizmanbacteria bacterium RIFCSPHIGHO2_12_FULL_39_8]